MATPLSIILSWFETGDFPTQSQFAKSWSSFWHKEEAIPQANITNLITDLNNKAEKQQLINHINDPNAHGGSGSGSAARFGIEDTTTDKGQSRSVNMASNSFTLNDISGFNIIGAIEYQLIEDLDDIYFEIDGGAFLPELKGKTILLRNMGDKITEKDEALKIKVMEGDDGSPEYDFKETTVKFEDQDIYVYVYEPILKEYARLIGYYDNTPSDPKVNLNLPEEDYEGQKIVVFNKYNQSMALTDMPASLYAYDKDASNAAVQVYASEGYAGVSIDIFAQGLGNAGFSVGAYGMTAYDNIYHKGITMGGDYTKAQLEDDRAITDVGGVKQIVAKYLQQYFDQNPIPQEGNIGVYGNPYTIYANDLIYPVTMLEYINTIKADWYLPDPMECMGKTIIIIAKGFNIKLHGTIFRSSSVTELDVTISVTLKAFYDNGKPQWFVINEVKGQ